MTRVVHCMKEPYDIYIGRGKCPRTGVLGKWGNPFSHKSGTLAKFKVNTREEAVEAYRNWLPTQPQLFNSLGELRGKILACWCKPQSCHGDVIIDFLNQIEESEK